MNFETISESIRLFPVMKHIRGQKFIKISRQLYRLFVLLLSYVERL